MTDPYENICPDCLNPDCITDAEKQWDLDHPDGVISAEEQDAMDRYAAESCREEGCR